MIPLKLIDPDDLPLYAMQLLPPEEMEELTLQLQHSVEARKLLAKIYGELSMVALTAEMQAPSSSTKQRLMKQVGREKKEMIPSPLDRYTSGMMDAYAPRETNFMEEEEPVRQSVAGRVLPWVGWAIAAGIGFLAVNEHQKNGELMQTVATDRVQLKQTVAQADLANVVLETMKDRGAVHVELTSGLVKPVPTGRVTYVADRGSLIFVASNLEPLQPTKTYELWVIPADGTAPIPAGTFKPDERGYASVVLPELQKGVEAKAFGVTIEDGDGSQTPTLPIVLKGQPA